jgi:hypothetical protein
MTQAASLWLLTAENKVRFQASLCEFCGGISGTGTGVPPTTLLSPCHYHSINSVYTFMIFCHTSQTLTLARDVVTGSLLYLPCVLYVYFNAQLLVDRYFFSRKLILSYEFILMSFQIFQDGSLHVQ